MSINSALLSGVSGLLANAAKLGTISDNIANVNTVGYKRNQTDFQTIVTAASGNKGSYSAGGVLAQSSQRVSQQGQLQRTGNTTDLGVNGQGFFVTTEKPENLTAGDARMFTRAGSFTVDEFGYLQNSAGLYLQGWPANADGEIEFDPSDLARLNSINVSQVGVAVEETTRSSITANLNDASPIAPHAATYNTTGDLLTTMSGTNGTDGVDSDFDISIPVIDSKGGRRSIMLSFLKVAPTATDTNANQWHVEIRADPASSVETAGAQNGLIRAGTVQFTDAGDLDLTQGTLFTTPAWDGTIVIGESDGAAPTAGSVKWADSLGIGSQSVALNLSGLTQKASATTVREVTSDGTPVGNVANIEIDKDGFVNALFDTGVTRRVAQIAVATFPNPDGLKALSGNSYQASNTSGTFNLKTPGTGGAGLLSPATLEASTVDLSTEFTGLITTQRAYSASSKIITTADEMLEELIRIKR